MHVLVIDDSRAMRSILRKALLDLGHDVTEAGNGQEGMDRLKSGGPFDLSLVDWNMPIMNGFEFVQTVRSDPAFSTMKIVMVTTEVETSQISKALEAGANEYVMKPFTTEILKDKIATLAAA